MDETSPPSHKKRRALNEIANTMTGSSITSKRRNSLGFDLVKIDHSDISKIPTTRGSLVEVAGLSNIPTLNKRPQIAKLLEINKSLNEKCRIPSSSIHDQSIDEEIARLESQLLTLSEELENEETELARTRLDSERHEIKLSELIENKSQAWKKVLGAKKEFEMREDESVNSVELKERQVKTKITELELKQDSEYRMKKAELDEEIAENAKYAEGELTEVLQKLEREKGQLSDQIKLAKMDMETKLRNELERLGKIVDDTVTEKEREVLAATEFLESVHKEHGKMLKKQELVRAEVDSLENQIGELESVIRAIHSDANASISTKESLERRGNELDHILGELIAEDSRLGKERDIAKAKLLAALLRFDIYRSSVENLENAIENLRLHREKTTLGKFRSGLERVG